MQWNAANISVAEMKALGGVDWSVVHSFYANAGGFIRRLQPTAILIRALCRRAAPTASTWLLKRPVSPPFYIY